MPQKSSAVQCRRRIFSEKFFGGWRLRGCGVRRGGCPSGSGAAAQRSASRLKVAASGQALGRKIRMRAAPSTTRAAILIRHRRKVLNSASTMAEPVGAAARRL